MPPVSSLIFVVILAVWAVYLVQHWVRRRDHLATARSVDRFSEAMRVLERRRALPRPDVAEHAPASASVPLLRPARPEVVVKRGAPAATLPTQPTQRTLPTQRTVTAQRARPAGSTAVAPSAAYRRSKRVAQLRAAGLLVSSLVMVTLAGLVGFQLVHWAWAFAGIALLAATVGGLRLSVARGRRALPRSRPVTRPVARPVARPVTRPVTGARPELAAQAAAISTSRAASRQVDLSARTVATAATAATAATVAAAATPALYDVEEVEAAFRPTPSEAVPPEPVQPEVSEPEPAAPGAWSPVPVPPPTYTLKARAYRAPAELPADGAEMALEEEFEELPAVRSVG